MKLFNTANRRKEVGYAIRRDIKESYAKECERKCGVPVLRQHMYLVVPSVIFYPESTRIGADDHETCRKVIDEYISRDPSSKEVWDFSITKITCIEEKVE